MVVWFSGGLGWNVVQYHLGCACHAHLGPHLFAGCPRVRQPRDVEELLGNVRSAMFNVDAALPANWWTVGADDITVNILRIFFATYPMVRDSSVTPHLR